MSSFEIFGTPILADGSTADYLCLLVVFLLGLACISYEMGILGLVIRDAATTVCLSSSSAGDASDPPTPYAPGYWPVPRSTITDATTARSSRFPIPEVYAWERPNQHTPYGTRNAGLKSNYTEEERAKGVEWAAMFSLQRKNRRADSARPSKQVRFRETVTEIAPPSPEPEPVLASADQGPLHKLQAALRVPDLWYYAPGSVGPYGGVSGLQVEEMPAYRPAPGFGIEGLYQPVQAAAALHPEPTIVHATSTLPSVTSAPSTTGHAVPPTAGPAPVLVPSSTNAGAATAGPSGTNTNAVAATAGSSAHMTIVEGYLNMADRYMTPILTDKVSKGPSTAWRDHTGNQRGRENLTQAKGALTKLNDFVRDDNRALDESKVSKSAWRARGLDTRISNLINELENGKVHVDGTGRTPMASVQLLLTVAYKVEALFS